MAVYLDNEIDFTVKGIKYGIFFAEDGCIEVYEMENPSKTGFIFPDRKSAILFINTITDILEKKMNKEKQ